MKFAVLAAVVAASLSLSPPEHSAHAPPAAATNHADHADHMAALADGNARFVSGHSLHENTDPARRREVATGQHPFAVIVGCADSRVAPEVVFDQGLGELFVVRCAGNVLGDPGIASIEYAVEHLGCELIVVLGHERCGAVDAVLKGGKLPGHLGSLATPIAPAVEEARRMAGEVKPGDILDEAVRANVRRVVKEIAASAPILAGHVKAGKARVVGARYDLDTGEVEFLGTKTASNTRKPSPPAAAPAAGATTKPAATDAATAGSGHGP